MTDIDDGGPAFPNLGYNAEKVFNGMTLRDWFAGQAMPIIMSDKQALSKVASKAGITPVRYAALASWGYADAMLAARKETK
jgi:hypothetical protein